LTEGVTVQRGTVGPLMMNPGGFFDEITLGGE
jgi:hypothetical protein